MTRIKILIIINFVAAVGNTTTAIMLLSDGDMRGLISFALALIGGYVAAILSLYRTERGQCGT